MVAIPIPNGTAPGYRPQESAGRLINCFAEPLGENRRDFKIVRSPGLKTFLTTGSAQDNDSARQLRGMVIDRGTIYAAFQGIDPSVGGDLWKATAEGAMTPVVATGDPSLIGTGSVYFARNNANPPDIAMLRDTSAFRIVGGSSVVAYGSGLGTAPSGMCMLDGYFVFTSDDGTIQASGLNTPNVATLSLGTTTNKFDLPVRPIPYGGRLLIFNTQSFEVWTDVGSVPFPFQRQSRIPVGLLARDAIAGWEEGWGAGLMWVADDYSVRQLDGYTPVNVGHPDLSRLIQRDPNRQNLRACVYVVDGHAMWTLTGSNFTWTYDLTTKKWHERASIDLQGPPYGTVQLGLGNRWRGQYTIKGPQAPFDKWLIGDRYSGSIYAIDPTVHTEVGVRIPIVIESAPVEKFPQRIRVARADFHIETGRGNAEATVLEQIMPQVGISWSDDGGVNWGNPLFRGIGPQVEDRNISVFGAGMSTRHGRRWRLEFSDAIYVAFFGGEQSAELRTP